MAIYHFSAKTVSRAAGRSSTGAAAYRSGERIVDKRTGEIHDYTRKQGVLDSDIFLPSGGTMERAALWNAVEDKHKRGDATVAREFVVALPDELSAAQRSELARSYARELADKYGVAVDLNIHAPGKDGDQRNHHAHILMSACYVGVTGTMGKKAVELDPIHCQRHKLPNVVEVERERWEQLANQTLEKAGQDARIDRRSLADQGIEDRAPSIHFGPTATAIVRRGGASEVEERGRQQADEFMADMQARAALVCAARKDVADLESQLDTLRWQVTPAAERLKVLEARRKELQDQSAALYRQNLKAQVVAGTSLPAAEIEAAKAALPAALQRHKAAQAKVAELRQASQELPWWKVLQRRKVAKELPAAEAEAREVQRHSHVIQLWSKSRPREQAREEQATLAKAEKAVERQLDPILQQIGVAESELAAQKAQEARQAIMDRALGVGAMIERQRAAAAAQKAAERGRRTEPSRDRDYDPGR